MLSLSRSRVRVCIKLLTAPDFCECTQRPRRRRYAWCFPTTRLGRPDHRRAGGRDNRPAPFSNLAAQTAYSLISPVSSMKTLQGSGTFLFFFCFPVRAEHERSSRPHLAGWQRPRCSLDIGQYVAAVESCVIKTWIQGSTVSTMMRNACGYAASRSNALLRTYSEPIFAQACSMTSPFSSTSR